MTRNYYLVIVNVALLLQLLIPVSGLTFTSVVCLYSNSHCQCHSQDCSSNTFTDAVLVKSC